MSYDIPEAVLLWCLATGLLAVTVLLVRQNGITARTRRRNAELTEALRARDAEVRHLVAVRLPAVEGAPAHDGTGRSVQRAGLRDERLAGTDFAAGLEGVLERFTGAVAHAQARADRSAKAALKTSMRAVQALASEQQVAISAMQERHDHPDVLRDLLEIDHTNAQFGRRAQAIAVLSGSWPGRQRAASPLTDVVRGAKSRIRDYRRVRVHGRADLALESRAVEPVVLAVAELLDNAARHSQPSTGVEVDVQAVHNGACVVIDDAGVGMDRQATRQAALLLSGQKAVNVTQLDDPPQFGFAAIGVLAARYGFEVSVDTRSPYGGVRAVLFLPSPLLTHVTGEPAPPTPPTPLAPPAPAPAGGTEAALGTTAGGLPRRRRRTPAQSAPSQSVPSPSVPEQHATRGAQQPQGRTAAETAQRMGAFARGTRHGRAGRASPDHERSTEE
ncbi:ATP-binding protein [Streptomyces sp. NPDC048172]|uniref:ATP-binding protein n=1 Tax=Streptomyces sp. NPDC048172 TaxID=3365505 RepID=UPI003723C71D